MKKLTVIAIAAALAILTACGGTAGSSQEGDGTLTFGSTFAHATLDPDLIPIRQMWMYLAPMYDTLTSVDGDRSVEPRLATKWTAGSDEKGPYLDMMLRQGLTFDDGTPLTSATVVANVKRSQQLEGSSNAAVLADVTVEKLGKQQVRFRSEQGVGALPKILAGPAGMMISDKAIRNGKDLTAADAGLGAFGLESVQPNRVVYAASADYWDDDAATVNKLEIQYLADEAKLNAVRSGELDITILPEDMTSTAESAGYAVKRSFGTENYLFSFNTTLEPFDDPRVRKAVNLSLDRKATCEGVLGGHCKPTGQIFGVGAQSYNEDLGLGAFSYDLDQAKQLITAAGAQGASAEIVTVAGNQDFVQLATVLQRQLNEIGLNAEVLPLAPPQVVSRFAVEKNVAIALGATGNAFDPSQSLVRYALPRGLYNPGKYTMKKLNKVAAAAMEETDQGKRIKMYEKISGMLGPSDHLVPVLTPQTAWAIAEHVKGWEMPWAPSFPSFRGVSG